jgi:hypothetical protein
LRLPTSLKDAVIKIAKRDGVSVNQFIAIAVAEKVSAMETDQFFAGRAKQADPKAFRTILFRPCKKLPRTGDELD